MKSFEVTEHKFNLSEGVLSTLKHLIFGGQKVERTGNKGIDAISQIYHSLPEITPRKIHPLKRGLSIEKRLASLEGLAKKYNDTEARIIRLEKEIAEAKEVDAGLVRELQAQLTEALRDKSIILKDILQSSTELKQLRGNLPRLYDESINLTEGVTSILLAWFKKRGANFTPVQKNTIELLHTRFNKLQNRIEEKIPTREMLQSKNDQLQVRINKLTAESNAGENIDFNLLKSLQDAQAKTVEELNIVKSEITSLKKQQDAIKDEIVGVARDAGVNLSSKPVKESNVVISPGDLRAYLRGLIDDAIDKEQDIGKLSKILKMLVGKEIKSRGKRYMITSEDIYEALNAK